MKAGFSNLDYLKRQILGENLKDESRFDDVLVALGLGVAGTFEKFCNRKFAFSDSAQDIRSADRVAFILSRLPVQTVSKIELKLTEALGWQELVINDVITTIDNEAGIVHFAGNADVGPDYAQVRFTYSGGYWWNTLEPDDEAYSLAVPANAIALPDDIRLAWINQCRKVWQSVGKIGDSILDDGDKTATISGALDKLDLLPDVKRSLGDYIIYSLV